VHDSYEKRKETKKNAQIQSKGMEAMLVIFCDFFFSLLIKGM